MTYQANLCKRLCDCAISFDHLKKRGILQTPAGKVIKGIHKGIEQMPSQQSGIFNR